MKSAWTQRLEQAYSENSQMGSLQSRHKSLSLLVPDVLLEDMVHVIGGVYCPVSVLYGNPGIHTSNGVYLARRLTSVTGDSLELEECKVVYVSCSHCVVDKTLLLPKEDENKKRLADIVAGGEHMQYPWVAYTPGNYPRIVEAATGNKTPEDQSKRITKKHNAGM